MGNWSVLSNDKQFAWNSQTLQHFKIYCFRNHRSLEVMLFEQTQVWKAAGFGRNQACAWRLSKSQPKFTRARPHSSFGRVGMIPNCEWFQNMSSNIFRVTGAFSISVYPTSAWYGLRQALARMKTEREVNSGQRRPVLCLLPFVLLFSIVYE